MSDVIAASDAQAIVRSEREARRAALLAVVERNPGGKLAAKASAMIQDFEALRSGIEEAGSEEVFALMINAAVAGGELLTDWCMNNGQHRGVIWAFLCEKPERIEAYYRAKEGRADEFGDEVVPLADSACPDDLGVRKWQGEARMRMAAIYNRQRFSDKAVAATGAVTVQIIQFGKGESADAIAARVKGITLETAE